MVRIILGVIVGFMVWSIVWVGGQSTISALSPDWYGANIAAGQKAMAEGSSIMMDTGTALVNLALSIAASFIAGYMCALAAGEYRRSTMALGIILIIVGVVVEFMFWNVAPAWYHILFVLLLYPITVIGGRLRRPN